jgi:hypothetical protein
MSRNLNYAKVNIGFIMQILNGQALTNFQVTSGNIPTDAVFASYDIDRTTNPPTLIIGYTSTTAVAGFVLPETASGSAHKGKW